MRINFYWTSSNLTEINWWINSFFFSIYAAPENWRELRSKPELQCTELTELHLADWVSSFAILIYTKKKATKYRQAKKNEVLSR